MLSFLLACAEEMALLPGPHLVINEVMVHNGAGYDQVELYNAGDQSATGETVCGWFDVGPGEFRLIEHGDDCDFGLTSSQTLELYDHPTGTLLDSVSWTEFSPYGGSYGRVPDGTGEIRTLSVATPGEPNEAD